MLYIQQPICSTYKNLYIVMYNDLNFVTFCPKGNRTTRSVVTCFPPMSLTTFPLRTWSKVRFLTSFGSADVTQLAELSLLAPQVRGSIPIIGKFYLEHLLPVNCIEQICNLHLDPVNARLPSLANCSIMRYFSLEIYNILKIFFIIFVLKFCGFFKTQNFATL